MKNKYLVYFEVYGKKMKTEVYADNMEDAKILVKNKLNEVIFHKVELQEDFNDITNNDIFKTIFGNKW